MWRERAAACGCRLYAALLLHQRAGACCSLEQQRSLQFEYVASDERGRGPDRLFQLVTALILLLFPSGGAVQPLRRGYPQQLDHAGATDLAVLAVLRRMRPPDVNAFAWGGRIASSLHADAHLLRSLCAAHVGGGAHRGTPRR